MKKNSTFPKDCVKVFNENMQGQSIITAKLTCEQTDKNEFFNKGTILQALEQTPKATVTARPGS